MTLDNGQKEKNSDTNEAIYPNEPALEEAFKGIDQG